MYVITCFVLSMRKCECSDLCICITYMYVCLVSCMCECKFINLCICFMHCICMYVLFHVCLRVSLVILDFS